MPRRALARGAVKLGRKAIKEIKKTKVSEPKSNIELKPKKVYDRSTRGRTPSKTEEAARYQKETRAVAKETKARKESPSTIKKARKKAESLQVDRKGSARKAKQYLEEKQPGRRRRRAARAARRAGTGARATTRTPSTSRGGFVDPRGNS